MSGLPIDPSPGQWVGIVIVLALVVLVIWEMATAPLWDEDEPV